MINTEFNINRNFFLQMLTIIMSTMFMLSVCALRKTWITACTTESNKYRSNQVFRSKETVYGFDKSSRVWKVMVCNRKRI